MLWIVLEVNSRAFGGSEDANSPRGAMRLERTRKEEEEGIVRGVVEMSYD